MCSKHSKPFAGSSQHLHGSALLVSVGFCFSASRSVAAVAAVAAVAKARTLQVIHGPSATRCRNLSGRLLIFHVTQEVIVGAYFLRFQLFTYHHIST